MGDDHARCSVSDMHSSLAGVLPGHALVSRHSPLSLYTHVKVAEENLLGTRDPDVERGFFLHMRSLANDFGRQCNGRGRARPPMRPQPAPAQPLDDQEDGEEKPMRMTMSFFIRGSGRLRCFGWARDSPIARRQVFLL